MTLEKLYNRYERKLVKANEVADEFEEKPDVEKGDRLDRLEIELLNLRKRIRVLSGYPPHEFPVEV